MGGDEYDRVGNTSWSHRDADTAIKKITTATGIQTEGVTIVLLYQNPRVEQWLSIFTQKIMEGSSSDTAFGDDYEEFLCNPESASERIETLETAMNPLLLSTIYINAGYNVAMIDLEGVRDAGLMVEHVIGCEILGGNCTDGWLYNLKTEDSLVKFKNYHEREDNAKHPFHSLTIGDIQDLERLLQLRDCNYRSITDHSNFRLLVATPMLFRSKAF
ncbi:unnamed protein product [Pseudo-nitzschia multistriata]|uniref:Uncharacterized protein n=1 Tax=Pseudo-nitzschia multistriata TaxID=183589 RepID=A0A448YW19_9STRA|nr:unnamed protein product [Pseudo-nitzschia multistriata]